MMKGKGMKGEGKGMKGEGKGKGTSPWTRQMANPDLDMKGKPGPHGEPPETGRWSFESAGVGQPKRWKWKKERSEEEREAKRQRKAMEAGIIGAAGMPSM